VRGAKSRETWAVLQEGEKGVARGKHRRGVKLGKYPEEKSDPLHRWERRGGSDSTTGEQEKLCGRVRKNGKKNVRGQVVSEGLVAFEVSGRLTLREKSKS